MFHVTEAGHANMYSVVGCLRGEKPPLREVGPPEQSQRDLRRPLEEPRPYAAPNNKPRPSQTQYSIHLRIQNHTSTNHITTSLRTSIAVSPSLVPAWGFGAALAHRRDAKSDSLAGAGKNLLPVRSRGAPWRTLAVARLVDCQRVFLDLWCVIRISGHKTPFLYRTQSLIFYELLFDLRFILSNYESLSPYY